MKALTMKKMRGLILSSLVIFSLIVTYSSTLFASGSVDFNVKITTAGDDTFTNNLTNISNLNTDVTFQFVEASVGGPAEYSINLPLGFVYQSHNTTDNLCASFSILDANNGNYRFSFSGSVGCLAKTEFTYRVTSLSIAGNTNVFLLEKNGSTWDILTNVTLGIVATNSITKAVSADLNSNGSVDAYVLSLATSTGVTANMLSGVTIAGVSRGVATASGTDWIIPFTDSALGTGDTPEIGGVFDGVTLTNNTINEEDRALPRIMTIAGTSTNSGTITIGTGALTMALSEPFSPTSTGSFSLTLGTGSIAGNMSLTGNLSTLIFTPTSALLPGTYTLSNTTGATDWSAGANILSQIFPSLIVPDITSPSAGSILINTGVATTSSQAVSLSISASDNVGVTEMIVSNSPTFIGASWEAYSTSKASWSLASSVLGIQTVYIQFRDLALNISPTYSDTITLIPASSGGGGGGGGGGSNASADFCFERDLSGNFYDGKCDAPATLTGTTSVSDISSNTIDSKYFPALGESQKYLLEHITHRAIIKLINSYGDQLAIPDAAYFLAVDSALYKEYNKTMNSYVLLFLRVQEMVNGNKTSTVKNDAIANYRIVTNGMNLAKNFLDKYVSRDYDSEKNITLYRTKNPLLTQSLATREKKILSKFDALLQSGTIPRSEYETSLQAYNDFVLHIILYRDYGKNPLSKERAMSAMRIFIATYKKQMIEPILSVELQKKQEEYRTVQ